MKTLFLLLVFVLFFSIVHSQSTDSLYVKFMNTYNASGDHIYYPDEKCGFGLINNIKLNYDKFTREQQAILKTFLTRPQRDTSIVSPSGIFRIHFDLTGNNKPFYQFNGPIPQNKDTVLIMVDSLAAAFDFSYNYEINVLNYPVPPTDNENGGDDRIDVYIGNLGAPLYGFTAFEDDLGGRKLTSYIEIDNDFSIGYFTSGLDAAKVTAAHELHHVIQLGSYGLWNSDIWYYEVTATSMEEFVYDDINDYYGAIGNYLNRTQETIKSNNGYNLTILNLYFEQKYNVDFIKRIWEFIEDVPPLQAISNTLLENGSTFKEAFNEFGIWTFFTSYRTQPGRYFEEAFNYPAINSIFEMDFTSPSTAITINSRPVSNNFIVFPISEGGRNDTIVALVTNSDISGAINSQSTTISFDYILAFNSFEGSTKLVDNFYKRIESSLLGLLSDRGFYNNQLIEGGSVSNEIKDFAFPNPFNYSKHVQIFIPTNSNKEGFVDLNIYTVSTDLVYSNQLNIINNFVSWNGRDNDNNKLPTGIYFYAAKSGDDVNKGKIVIYNE